MVALIVVVVILVVLGFVVVGIYNGLVRAKNRYQNAFAQIEVQLKRRYDLIPNLVEIAKGYLKHEHDTLMQVTQARNQALSSLRAANPENNASIHQLGNAEVNVQSAMRGLNVQLEAYPDLKANENMRQLSEEISSTENRVAFARQAYNDAVMSYNVQRQTFPANLVANLFGHHSDAPLLEFADSAEIQAAPKVQF